MADLGEILRVVGAGLRDINRPGTLAEALLAEQQRRGSEELRSIAGQQFGAQPITSPQQQPTAGAPNANIAQLAQLAAQGIPGANLLLQDKLARRATPLQERQIGLQERTFDLKNKQFNQTVREFEQSLKSPLNQKEILDQQGKLRKEFTDLSKSFIDQRDAFSRVEASAEDPSAAGDLSLIFNFMKVLDPGSVVREGEFANAQNSPGVSERVRAQYNRILSGERFTPQTRADFVNRSRKLFERAQKQHSKRTGQFTEIATKSGLDPQQIVLDLTLASEFAPQESQGAQGAPQGLQEESTEDILARIEQSLAQRG